jgi:GAF domain-containing protein
LDNARLLAETRAALTQVQEVYNEFTRTEWTRTVSRTEQLGFRLQGGRMEMLENGLQYPEVTSAIASGEVTVHHSNGSPEKRAAVAVPVKLRGQVIGILHIESSDHLKEWQEDELSLVQAVAERAAFAMENARLFQDARRRAAKERLISEAGARITGALNIENILQTTAEELERVLGGSEILIQFQSKEQS